MRATSGIFRWRADAKRASRRMLSSGLHCAEQEHYSGRGVVARASHGKDEVHPLSGQKSLGFAGRHSKSPTHPA